MYLELRKLLHELLLLFAVAQRRKNVEKDLQKVQILTRYTGEGEDGRHTVGRDKRHYTHKLVLNNFGRGGCKVLIYIFKCKTACTMVRLGEEEESGQQYVTYIITSLFSHTHMYLEDCANCCAAVTASSGLATTMGTLLQPGCLSTRSS